MSRSRATTASWSATRETCSRPRTAARRGRGASCPRSSASCGYGRRASCPARTGSSSARTGSARPSRTTGSCSLPRSSRPARSADGSAMLSRKTIEAYLFFLLRHRLAVSLVVAGITLVLGGFMWTRMHVFTNFFDLYPPGHPYIKLYTQYRSMFGTANTLLLVVETKNGTIFDDPETVQKVDRITLALLHDIPGVNGDQVLSITHPKLKTTLTSGSGIKVVPLMYPRVPETKDDLDFLKLKVYTTEGVKGPFVSEDDKATLIVAGFWEEYFDLPAMWQKIQEIVARESDDNTTIYVSGPPILYAYFLEIMPKMVNVLAASIVMILLILWMEFRSWQGVVIPAFSGALSAIWGLGFGGLWGMNLDPLVLVIPLLITARAHSHSVQSMER